MTAFLVAAQLPPALARWMQDQGYQAWHVADLAMTDAPDAAIWDRKFSMSAAIITKDEDFAMRRSAALSEPVVIWLRTGNSKRKLLSIFELLFPRILDALERDETLIEVR